MQEALSTSRSLNPLIITNGFTGTSINNSEFHSKHTVLSDLNNKYSFLCERHIKLSCACEVMGKRRNSNILVYISVLSWGSSWVLEEEAQWSKLFANIVLCMFVVVVVETVEKCKRMNAFNLILIALWRCYSWMSVLSIYRFLTAQHNFIQFFSFLSLSLMLFWC